MFSVWSLDDHAAVIVQLCKPKLNVIMWPNLRKGGFHAHNSKTHFSPSKWWLYTLTNYSARYIAKSCPGCFWFSLFLRLMVHPRVLGCSSNGTISLWQADSWLWFTSWLADEFGHGFSCFVWYVEVTFSVNISVYDW